MRLVADIGNTRAKWGLFRAGRVESPGAAMIAAVSDAAGWSEALAGIGRPDEVIVGCVGSPACLRALEDFATSTWALQPRSLQAGKAFGRISNGYAAPAILGIDRWAAIVAATNKVPGALCVISAGSACTVDVVDPSGCHQGGWVVPGLVMQAALLSANTQGVRPHRVAPSLQWGRDTAACVSNGALGALVGMIELACARADGEWGAATCILTGGDAGPIAGVLARPVQVYPDLVIEGLDLLASSEGDSF